MQSDGGAGLSGGPPQPVPAGQGPRRVVVATGNPGKLDEIRATLDLPGWSFVAAGELGEWPEVPETGDTFMENALIKARAAVDLFGIPALADDSGLEVDALGGAPGVRSSRYAGDRATDDDNNHKLLQSLADVPDAARTARFRSVIVLLELGGRVWAGEGSCEGRIGHEPRGTGGFGYDPLFLPDATPGRTMAELAIAEKNAISHRGAALRDLRDELGRR
jgi:XTP/dITP diphosphohydrolase